MSSLREATIPPLGVNLFAPRRGQRRAPLRGRDASPKGESTLPLWFASFPGGERRKTEGGKALWANQRGYGKANRRGYGSLLCPLDNQRGRSCLCFALPLWFAVCAPKGTTTSLLFPFGDNGGQSSCPIRGKAKQMGQQRATACLPFGVYVPKGQHTPFGLLEGKDDNYNEKLTKQNKVIHHLCREDELHDLS